MRSAPSVASKDALFSRKAEYAFWALLVLGALGLAAEMFFFEMQPGPTLSLSLRLFADVVLLGATHVVLTVCMLVYLPEFRAWSRTKMKNSLALFWLLHGLAFVGLFAGFYALHKQAKISSAALFGAYIFVDSFLRVRHYLQQFKGISLQYNYQLRQNCNFDSYELICLRNNERKEKRAFQLLSIFSLSALALTSYNLYFPSSWSFWTTSGLFLASLTTVTYIVLLARRTPFPVDSAKHNYLLRLFFVPFINLSIFANAFMRLMHGLEYLLLTQGMVGKSSASKPAKAALWASSVVFMAGVAASVFFAQNAMGVHVYGFSPQNFPALIPLLSFDSTMSLMHYYFDMRAFKFRDPDTRRLIGPLLVSSPLSNVIYLEPKQSTPVKKVS